jgi:hypothetical protein
MKPTTLKISDLSGGDLSSSTYSQFATPSTGYTSFTSSHADHLTANVNNNNINIGMKKPHIASAAFIQTGSEDKARGGGGKTGATTVLTAANYSTSYPSTIFRPPPPSQYSSESREGNRISTIEKSVKARHHSLLFIIIHELVL